mgnify:FL=1
MLFRSVYNRSLVRSRLTSNIEALTEGLAANSAVALAFDDQKAATRTLETAGVNPQIDVAAVLRPDGTVMARYIDPQTEPWEEGVTPASLQSGRGTWFTDQHLHVVRPIELDGERLGTLYVRTGTDDLRTSARRLVLALIMFGASIVTILITLPLVRLITSPIEQLTDRKSVV